MFTDRTKNIAAGIFILTITVILLVSLLSYHPDDLALYTSHPNIPPQNLIRVVGAWTSGVLFFILGLSAYLIPVWTLLLGIDKFRSAPGNKWKVRSVGIVVFFISVSTIIGLLLRDRLDTGGGLIGMWSSNVLRDYLGDFGAYLITGCMLVLSILLTSEFLLLQLVAKWGRKTLGLFQPQPRGVEITSKVTRQEIKPRIKIAEEERARGPAPVGRQAPRQEEKPPEIIIKTKDKKGTRLAATAAPRREQIVQSGKAGSGDYRLPSLDLLDSPPPVAERQIKDDLENNARILEETLRDFGIEVKVAQIDRGPVITRYEIQPAAGVKVTRIVALSDDIALALKAPSVRIVAPIPGKARVGVEVPNTTSTMVFLREIFESKEFQSSRAKLTLAVGKDISGATLVTDLSDMPHLLIAGTTGSGKTVCINSLIMSVLFSATPDEVRFLMIDPKMVELSAFRDIPHLLCPVVTEPKKVSVALAWLVNEMEERYKLFAMEGVRNIELYNNKFKESPLPYFVVIIDELADLMMVASADIESAITRLAQLSRAVGIHIILATQRPSVDVITGVIKANFPARIAFQVASKVDSRTVLDMNGADKLLGKGDLLFLRPGTSKPIRAQGSLVNDHEIERVVTFVKEQRSPQYVEEILKGEVRRPGMEGLGDDELFDEASKIVIETGQASASMLQRRLRLGYTRAARLIDMMEEKGIVGPPRGSKRREILIDQIPDEESTVTKEQE